MRTSSCPAPLRSCPLWLLSPQLHACLMLLPSLVPACTLALALLAHCTPPRLPLAPHCAPHSGPQSHPPAIRGRTHNVAMHLSLGGGAQHNGVQSGATLGLNLTSKKPLWTGRSLHLYHLPNLLLAACGHPVARAIDQSSWHRGTGQTISYPGQARYCLLNRHQVLAHSPQCWGSPAGS